MDNQLMFQDPETFKRLMEQMQQMQQQQQGLPNHALSSPTPTLQMLYGGDNPMLKGMPEQQKTPWGDYAMYAAMGAAPVANSILSNRRPPPQLLGGTSLGSKGMIDPSNFYAMFKNKGAGANSMLAKLIRNR